MSRTAAFLFLIRFSDAKTRVNRPLKRVIFYFGQTVIDWFSPAVVADE
jgi:hypothetical protein